MDADGGAVFDGVRATDGTVSECGWTKGGTDDTDGTVSDIGWA